MAGIMSLIPGRSVGAVWLGSRSVVTLSLKCLTQQKPVMSAKELKEDRFLPQLADFGIQTTNRALRDYGTLVGIIPGPLRATIIVPWASYGASKTSQQAQRNGNTAMAPRKCLIFLALPKKLAPPTWNSASWFPLAHSFQHLDLAVPGSAACLCHSLCSSPPVYLHGVLGRVP